MLFKPLCQVLLFAFSVLIGSCIDKFIPETSEDKNLIVVEGLITDQPGQNVIKISTSMPLGVKSSAKPLTGCNVTVSDNLGNNFSLQETVEGIYVTDPTFQGVTGRSYILHIKTNEFHGNLSYQSSSVLMKPVPALDSIYYDKLVLSRADDGWPSGEGCQIYLNTHDPENSCRFYRWEYIETWEIVLPYFVPNNVCWVSANSDIITIKSTSSLSEDRIERLPVNFISNATDRLNVKYSILVNQYSLNEDEYGYWEKLRKITEQVGSLYDIIPSSIPSNILCVEKPDENVLGYFSVSSVKSKRIFIKDHFKGMVDLYRDCENVVIGYNDFRPNLNSTEWVIIDRPEPPPGYKVLTFHKGCADCSVRGTTTQPYYWNDTK